MSTNFLARHYNAMTDFPRRIDGLTQTIKPWVVGWQTKSSLDAGCGGGALMFALDQLGVDVVGLDLSESMLRLALDNARTAGKTFRFCGAPFGSAGRIFPEKFDTVFVLGNALIGHDTDSDMIDSLSGLIAALKPGGQILIQNLNITPFFLGQKKIINRRTVDDVRYMRFAVPIDHDHLFFSAFVDGPGEQFEITTHVWANWHCDRLASCLDKAGFHNFETYGGLNRSTYDPRTSTDLVIAAAKPLNWSR